MVTQRWRVLATLLVAIVAVTGCGRTLAAGSAARVATAEDVQPGSDDGSRHGGPDRPADGRRSGGTGGRGARAPGAPFGASGNVAVVAPVKIPAFTIVGAPFHEQRAFVVDEIVDACGDGSQCVGIVIVVQDATSDSDPDNDLFEPCAVLAGTPAQTVERGGSITFRVAAPCGDDGAPTDAASQGPAPGGGGPGDAQAGESTDPDDGDATTDPTGEGDKPADNGDESDGDADADTDTDDAVTASEG